MDNEEIREILKELKESSDESSAVRSRVVKIHFDTPQEAERRERERKRAAEAARQKALREEEERKELEEERREVAEKEAEAVVAEAKAEAAAKFSADFSGTDDEGADAEEEADEGKNLHFNWNYDRRHMQGEILSHLEIKGLPDTGDDAKESESEKADETSVSSEQDQEDLENKSGRKGFFSALKGRFSGLSSVRGKISAEKDESEDEGSEEAAGLSGDAEEKEKSRTSAAKAGKLSGKKSGGGMAESRPKELKIPEEEAEKDPDEVQTIGRWPDPDRTEIQSRQAAAGSSALSGDRSAFAKESEEASGDMGSSMQDDFASDADDFREDGDYDSSGGSSGRAKDRPSALAGASALAAAFTGLFAGKGKKKDRKNAASVSGGEAELPDERSGLEDPDDMYRSERGGLEDPDDIYRSDRDGLEDPDDMHRSDRGDRAYPEEDGGDPADILAGIDLDEYYLDDEEDEEKWDDIPEDPSVNGPYADRNSGGAEGTAAGPAGERSPEQAFSGRMSGYDKFSEKGSGEDWPENSSGEDWPENSSGEDWPEDRKAGDARPAVSLKKGESAGSDSIPDGEDEDFGDISDGPAESSSENAEEKTKPQKKLSDLLGQVMVGRKKKDSRYEEADIEAIREAFDTLGAEKRNVPAEAEAEGGESQDSADPAESGQPDDDASSSEGQAFGTSEDGEEQETSAGNRREAGDSSADDRQNEGRQSGRRQSIEVVDLDETANNRGIEVIEFDKQATGALPSAAQMKSAFSRKEAEKKKQQKKKILLTAGLAAAAFVLILLVIFAVKNLSPGGSGAGGTATADEGLTVRILEEPSEYTTEGDVRLMVKTAEPLQSITINGENVPFEGEKKTELDWHADGNTLDLMVVSGDKLRNAVVQLAYVDSTAPDVMVSSSGNEVTLSAEDNGSGIAGIYYGTFSGISDVPKFELYTGPFTVKDDEYISYYAADNAGNKSVPVTSTLRAAESISFNESAFTVFPGTETHVAVKVVPEGAYCNGLTLSISDPSIASISEDGVLKGIAEGETQLMATADGVKGIACNVTVSKERKVKLSMIGDCTLGTDANFSPMSSFNAYQSMYGDSYFFEKVRGIFQADDSTFANFEGTLTEEENRADKEYAFKGDPAFANILVDGDIQVVSLANNHSSDYGEKSLTDTEKNLEAAGIDWCEGDNIAYETRNGVKCAFIGIYALQNGLEKKDQVERTVAAAKAEGAQIITVAFHWSNELVTDVDEYQIELAHAAIDAGASLVVGHHPHVLQGIELYNGRYIVYSLGNFCFGGNITPTDTDTIIFQQTFTVTAEGVGQNDEIAIIPCSVSTDPTVNNYQPTAVSGADAERIMTKINERSAAFNQTWTNYYQDGTAM